MENSVPALLHKDALLHHKADRVHLLQGKRDVYRDPQSIELYVNDPCEDRALYQQKFAHLWHLRVLPQVFLPSYRGLFLALFPFQVATVLSHQMPILMLYHILVSILAGAFRVWILILSD